MAICFFVWFDSKRPINNISVIKGRVFLGWTSPKLGLMCLAQGHTIVTLVRLESAAPQSRVKHSTTEPLRSPVWGKKELTVLLDLRDNFAKELKNNYYSWSFSFNSFVTFHGQKIWGHMTVLYRDSTVCQLFQWKLNFLNPEEQNIQHSYKDETFSSI